MKNEQDLGRIHSSVDSQLSNRSATFIQTFIDNAVNLDLLLNPALQLSMRRDARKFIANFSGEEHAELIRHSMHELIYGIDRKKSRGIVTLLRVIALPGKVDKRVIQDAYIEGLRNLDATASVERIKLVLRAGDIFSPLFKGDNDAANAIKDSLDDFSDRVKEHTRVAEINQEVGKLKQHYDSLLVSKSGWWHGYALSLSNQGFTPDIIAVELGKIRGKGTSSVVRETIEKFLYEQRK